MSQRPLLVLLVLALAGCARQKRPDPPPPEDISVASVGVAFKASGPKSKRAGAKNSCYEDVATEVLRQVAELRAKYPALAQMDPQDIAWDDPRISAQRMWMTFRYDNAVELGPPDDKGLLPPVKAFTKDQGIALRMYFFTGSWPHAGIGQPVAIGAMSCVFQLETAKPELKQALAGEFVRILTEQAQRYDKRCEVAKRG